MPRDIPNRNLKSLIKKVSQFDLSSIHNKVLIGHQVQFKLDA